jgi:hypothetical protein
MDFFVHLMLLLILVCLLHSVEFAQEAIDSYLKA